MLDLGRVNAWPVITNAGTCSPPTAVPKAWVQVRILVESGNPFWDWQNVGYSCGPVINHAGTCSSLTALAEVWSF